MTKVSVLMPIYNTNTLYLKAAVESVLNQTFSDFELLILNDSPDNQELKKNHRQLRRQTYFLYGKYL